jgi:SAM-dependent methyltransferase
MQHSIFKHYRKLWFFNFHRYEGDNYRRMREYFAEVLIDDLEKFIPLQDKRVLDVGGANGEYCLILNQKRNCSSVNLDPNPQNPIWPNTTIGFSDRIPFPNESFDLVICRGVLEHMPTDRLPASLMEMYRVTKKGGACYIVVPPWYNPHAGHGLKPFHIFGFRVAKYLRELFTRKQVAGNSFEDQSLYKVTFANMARLLQETHYKLLATQDTHFRMHFLTKIPLVREILVPAVSFILQK